MADRLFELVRGYFDQYGYWTVAIALLLENAGIPVPGESILLFAGFLAFSQHHLVLTNLILVGVLAATLGDNIGYAIGRHGGRPLLKRYQHVFRIRQATIEHGESLFARHGSMTVFFARFIFGMRIIAGPLAGVLQMPWQRFVVANFLGAVLWVTVISCLGYFFGSQWQLLLHVLKRVDAVILIVIAALALFWWRRGRGRPASAKSQSPK